MSGLGVLQDDAHHDVAGVAAAVHGAFHQLVDFLLDDEFLGVVGAVVKFLDEVEHDLVGLALGVLEAVVGFADALDVGAAAELLDHEDDGVGGELEKLGLALEAGDGDLAGINGEALDDFSTALGMR